jgi:hypothetical protein
MTRLIDYVILTLAIYRITRLITTDVIFNKYRTRIWQKYPIHRDGLGYLITCPWCMSIWVSLPVVVMYRINTDWTIVGLSVFAFSTLVGFINRVD